MPGARERRRRAKLQQLLTALRLPHSADELTGVAAYRHVTRYHCLPAGEGPPGPTKRGPKHKARRLFEVTLAVPAAVADAPGVAAARLTCGRRLHFPYARNGHKHLVWYFSTVEEAVQARDEALFATFGMCAPPLLLVR